MWDAIGRITLLIIAAVLIFLGGMAEMQRRYRHEFFPALPLTEVFPWKGEKDHPPVSVDMFGFYWTVDEDRHGVGNTNCSACHPGRWNGHWGNIMTRQMHFTDLDDQKRGRLKENPNRR